MNLRAIICTALISFGATSSAFAQNLLPSTLKNSVPSLNSNAYVPIPNPSPVFPYDIGPNYARWVYAAPNVLHSNLTPVAEYYNAHYLPYLPWLGQNLALLANYANFFYQLEQFKLINARAPFATTTASANVNLTTTALPATEINASKQTTTSLAQVANTNPISGVLLTTTLANYPGTDTIQNAPASTNTIFNAETLFSTDNFSASQMQQVNFLTLLLSGMYQPLPNVNLSTDPTKRKQQLQSADIQNYILALRSYAAAQSMILSNLNYLAQERQVQSGLGTAAGMTTLPTDGTQKSIPNASQLQLEEFLVNRRVGNSSWYTAVNNAPEIAVQRETVYLLAEIQRQLFQMQMLNERMLATMSSMQTQMAQYSKSNLTSAQQNINNAQSQTD